MPDNVNITPGSGAVIASDEVAGAQYQRVKLTWGADGTANDASATNPLPVASVSGITGIADGRRTVTTAGTRVALAASSTPCKQVIVTALLANTGIIAVGGSTVVAAAATRTGVPLAAGDSVTLEIGNLTSVSIDATVNGEGVSYAYFT